MHKRTPGTIQAQRTVAALLLSGCALVGAIAAPARAGAPGVADGSPWTAAIRAMDEALGKGDVAGARRAREEAYLAAHRVRNWEAMADVGDATVRLSRGAGLGRALDPEARRAYLDALFRARRQASLDGVLRVTQAFAALGDHAVTRQAFVIGYALAAASGERHALERVRALEARLAAGAPFVGGVVTSAPVVPAPGAWPTRAGDAVEVP